MLAQVCYCGGGVDSEILLMIKSVGYQMTMRAARLLSPPPVDATTGQIGCAVMLVSRRTHHGVQRWRVDPPKKAFATDRFSKCQVDVKRSSR